MLKRRSRFQTGGDVKSKENPLKIPKEYSPLFNLDDTEALFKTSRGSTYAYHADKTSTRNRSGEKHTDKTTGLQPRSGKTVFMTNDDVNRVAGIFQNSEMATRLVPILDEQGRPTNKAKLELMEDYGPRKAGSTILTVPYTTTPETGLSPVEIYRSESKIGDPGRGVHFGTPITEVINKPARAAGKTGLMAAVLGAASGANASEIGESLLPWGITPSKLSPGTLTPEQKAASDAAYKQKLTEERVARNKAQALLRSGVKQEEPKMAKGGMMARNIPGFQEGGTNVDPVSGNEVPTGSLPEEVRDDVDAKLSPGEFVIPADVVRFIGLERLMKMRDEAKKGLQRMSDIGQMGNAEDVGEESNSTYEDSKFESEIDDILSEIAAEEESNGDVDEQTDKMMASGGFIKSGTDLSQAPKNPTFDVRYYKNDQGAVMFITHINGKPMTPIPEGFKLVSQEEAQKVGMSVDTSNKTTAAAATQAGTQTSLGEGAPGYSSGDLTPAQEKARAETLSNVNAYLTYLSPVAKMQAVMDRISPRAPAPVEDISIMDRGAQSVASSAYSSAINLGLSEAQATTEAAKAVDAFNSGKSPADAISGVFDVAMTQQSKGIAAELEAVNNTPSGGTGGGDGGYGGYGGTTGGGDTMGFGGVYAEGGLINRRQYPAKKKRGKGLAAK